MKKTNADIRKHQNEFKTIVDDFSTELSLLLKKYNVELYYNSCDEDTNIKYNGEELNVAITDLIKEQSLLFELKCYIII